MDNFREIKTKIALNLGISSLRTAGLIMRLKLFVLVFLSTAAPASQFMHAFCRKKRETERNIDRVTEKETERKREREEEEEERERERERERECKGAQLHGEKNPT